MIRTKIGDPRQVGGCYACPERDHKVLQIVASVAKGHGIEIRLCEPCWKLARKLGDLQWVREHKLEEASDGSS